MFIFSDSHSCALLKEKVMNLIAANLDNAMKSDGWSRVKESLNLMMEILRFNNNKFRLKRNDLD